jgi:hypothetical protein
MPRERFQEFAQSTVPAKHRDYLFRHLQALKHRYSRVIIPHVGNFEMAQMCMEAGFSARGLIASDIFLYPAVVGKFVNDEPLDDLAIRFLDPWMKKYLDPTKADDVLLGMKIAQIPETNYYYKKIVQEIKNNKGEYLLFFRNQLEGLKSRLYGMVYEGKDFLSAIKAGLDDETAMMWINPPKFGTEFLKLAKFNEKLDWKGVAFDKFKPIEQVPRIIEASLKAKALIVLRPHFLVAQELSDNLVHAVHLKPKVVDYLFCNRPEEFTKECQLRALSDVHPAPWAMMPDDYEIPVDAKISLHCVDRAIGLYYRDLFAHKLGAVRTEKYYLGLINQYIFCVFGLHAAKFQFRHQSGINETFGFCVPSKRHKRLNKLFMMAMVCGDGKKQFLKDKVWSEQLECEGIRTVCLSTYPELKINRGVMKLVHRSKVKDGAYSYKLHYYADFNKKTFGEVLREFLKNHGDK